MKQMILLVLVVHLLLCLTMFLLAQRHLLQIDKMSFVLVFLIPVYGELYGVLLHFMAEHPGKEKNEDDSGLMHEGDLRRKELPGARREEENAVPFEDVLLMNDAHERRSAMMDVLMQGSENYTNTIAEAQKNDDTEVVHYATSALSELGRDYALELQKYTAAYEADPDSQQLLDQYIQFLDRYIESGIADHSILGILRSRYRELLKVRLEVKNSISDYVSLVDSFLQDKLYQEAGQALKKMEEKYPAADETWLCKVKYFYCIQDGNHLHQLIEEMKKSSTTHNQKVRSVLAFYEGVNT